MYEVSPVLAAAVPRKPLQPRYMNTTMRSSFNDAYLSSRQRYYPNHGWNRYRTQSHFHYHHHQPSTHNLLPTVFFSPTTFIFALPLLKQTFPPFTLVTNLTSSHSPSFSPVLQIHRPLPDDNLDLDYLQVQFLLQQEWHRAGSEDSGSSIWPLVQTIPSAFLVEERSWSPLKMRMTM